MACAITQGGSGGEGGANRSRHFPKLYSFDVPDPGPKSNEQKPDSKIF